VEADQPDGEDALAEAEAVGSELDHASALNDPLSPDWLETEIGSRQEEAPAGDAGDEIGSWQRPSVSESAEDEIGSWSAVPEGTGEENVGGQGPGPRFEDAAPDGAGDAEDVESWWQEAPEGATPSTEWEAAWSPTGPDDALSAPEWPAAPKESPPHGELSDSIWGDAAETPTEPEDLGDADAASLWNAPAAGDVSWAEPEARQGDSPWAPPEERGDEPLWTSDPELSPEPPPAPAAEAPAGEPSDEPGDARPAAAAPGEAPSAPETSASESSGFRTVALQELRNLAGVAGTPVRLPGSARRPTDGGEASPHASPAPKIRALKRLIAAVRGL
jgi:hypothetical protein